MKRNLLIVLCLIFTSSSLAESPIIKADIIEDDSFLARYLQVLRGRQAAEISDFTPISEGSHRELVEMVLIEQALHLGGESRPVQFIKRAERTIHDITPLITGEALMLGNSMWLENIADARGSVYISDPVIEYGEYVAGLYVSVDNKRLLNAKYADLTNITVVTNGLWRADWRALQNTPVKILNYLGSWQDMISLVRVGLVDAMLINFSVGETLELEYQGHKYRPIPNMKVILPDTRHFVVSKNHPDGARVFKALNKGLAKLKAKGRIRKFYQQGNFFNYRVADWQVINTNMAPKQ